MKETIAVSFGAVRERERERELHFREIKCSLEKDFNIRNSTKNINKKIVIKA